MKYFDINDLEHIDKKMFEGVDVIFHMAALARIQPSLKRPQESINANVNGTLNVLELARKNNTPVIYAGSSSFHHGLYGSAYAWSKHAGEQLCELYSTVLGIFERQYRDNELLTVTGDGEQRRDFTHIDDIVDGLYKCMGKDLRAEVFELGRGKNFSINEIADMFGVDKKYIPARKGEYPTTLCDTSLAKNTLDWAVING